jgi:hypothetical protein
VLRHAVAEEPQVHGSGPSFFAFIMHVASSPCGG